MKQQLCLSLAFILPSLCLAQEWVKTTSNTTETITDIAFPTSTTGYASGTFGTIIKSTDAGLHWSRLKSPSQESFTAIAAIDAEHVFCGRNGLYKTDDGGRNWTEVGDFSRVGSSIFDIDFVSPSTGYLIKSGYIYKTIDAGETWREVYSEGADYFLDRLYEPEENVIIATGGFTRSEIFGRVSVGFIVRSADAGRTWDLLETQGIPDIIAADWPSPHRGLVFTQPGSVFQTTDGGKHWEEIATHLPELGPPLITAVRFANESLGYAVSFDGKMLQTDDGGYHWRVEAMASSQEGGVPLVALELLSNGVFAAGNDGLIFQRQRLEHTRELMIDAIKLRTAEGGADIWFHGKMGASYRIESSPDLQTPWVLESVTSPKEYPCLVSVPTKGERQRYFRVVELPVE